MAVEKEIKKEQELLVPICGICGRTKVRRLGFGGDYECPHCASASGIGFGNE